MRILFEKEKRNRQDAIIDMQLALSFNEATCGIILDYLHDKYPGILSHMSRPSIYKSEPSYY
jgi:hypothetical protein